MSVGRKTEYDATFLTSRAAYRTGVDAVDEFGPNDASIGEINLTQDGAMLLQNKAAGTADRKGAAGRGYNAHLELYVLLNVAGADCSSVELPTDNEYLVDGIVTDSACYATLRVWVNAALDGATQRRWALVHEQSALCDTLIPLRDIPAGIYKVTVDDLSAGCTVDILEQHTE